MQPPEQPQPRSSPVNTVKKPLEEQKLSPISVLSTEAATPGQMSADNRLEDAFSAIEIMMEDQPRIEQSPQVSQPGAAPSDFLRIAQAPSMPFRQHWTTDRRRVASIDDKFEAPAQDSQPRQ